MHGLPGVCPGAGLRWCHGPGLKAQHFPAVLGSFLHVCSAEASLGSGSVEMWTWEIPWSSWVL